MQQQTMDLQGRDARLCKVTLDQAHVLGCSANARSIAHGAFSQLNPDMATPCVNASCQMPLPHSDLCFYPNLAQSRFARVYLLAAAQSLLLLRLPGGSRA